MFEKCFAYLREAPCTRFNTEKFYIFLVNVQIYQVQVLVFQLTLELECYECYAYRKTIYNIFFFIRLQLYLLTSSQSWLRQNIVYLFSLIMVERH